MDNVSPNAESVRITRYCEQDWIDAEDKFIASCTNADFRKTAIKVIAGIRKARLLEEE